MTTAEWDGECYVLNGEKLWCTNGTLAELLVVMARDPRTRNISAFIVETAWRGVTVDHRCLRFIDRSCRKLARETFHGMVIHGARLEVKQAFLFRLVDLAMELLAMASSISRARSLVGHERPGGAEAIELADLFCRDARRKVRRLFADLWMNDDDRKNRIAERAMHEHAWMAEGRLPWEMRDADAAFEPPRAAEA